MNESAKELIKRLEELQLKLTRARTELAKLEGRKEQVLSNLKEKQKCESLEEASEKLKSVRRIREATERELMSILNALEEGMKEHDKS